MDNEENLNFFSRKVSRESSMEGVQFRSRSISSVSNNSLSNFLKGNIGTKKYFNLAAMDGFVMMEKDEEDNINVNQTILKGMDVESICADIGDQQNKNYHLDKLFNPQGPYYTQTQLFEQEKRNKSKMKRKKSVHYQRNYLDRIDSSVYMGDKDSDKNYGIANLFEDPKEREIRMSELISKKRRRKALT